MKRAGVTHNQLTRREGTTRSSFLERADRREAFPQEGKGEL